MQWLIERRLKNVSRRLRDGRAELAVLNEQVAHFAEDADELQTRAVVSEALDADYDYADAKRYADQMSKVRDDLVATITRLEQEQNDLLDRLGS